MAEESIAAQATPAPTPETEPDDFDSWKHSQSGDGGAEEKPGPEPKPAEKAPQQETEPPAEPGEEEPAGESDTPDEQEPEQPETKPDDGEKPRKRSSVQKRLDRQERKLREEFAAERAKLEQRLAALEGGKPPEPANARPAPTKAEELKPEDFETYEQYLDARDEAKTRQLRDELKAEKDAESSRAAAEAEQRTVNERLSESLKAAAEAHPDFEDRLEEADDVKLSPETIQIISRSESAGELYYELATHREDLERLAQLPPLSAARFLGKIEARIEARTSEPPPKPKLSTAPQPIRTVAGRGVPSRAPADSDDYDAWVEGRKTR